MKILLIEDEEGLITTLTDRLVSEGFEVVSANDGKKGLDAAASDRFNLIILDVMLPKKNGYDIGFRDFIRVGLPFTIAAVCSAAVFIWIFWS